MEFIPNLIATTINTLFFTAVVFITLYQISIIIDISRYKSLLRITFPKITEFRKYLIISVSIMLFELSLAAYYLLLNTNEKINPILDTLFGISHVLPFLLLWFRVRTTWKRLRSILLNRLLA